MLANRPQSRALLFRRRGLPLLPPLAGRCSSRLPLRHSCLRFDEQPRSSRQALQLGMPVERDRFAELVCATAGFRFNSGKLGRPKESRKTRSRQWADKKTSGSYFSVATYKSIDTGVFRMHHNARKRMPIGLYDIVPCDPLLTRLPASSSWPAQLQEACPASVQLSDWRTKHPARHRLGAWPNVANTRSEPRTAYLRPPTGSARQFHLAQRCAR